MKQRTRDDIHSRDWLRTQETRLKDERDTLRREILTEAARYETSGGYRQRDTGDAAEEEREDRELAPEFEALQTRLWSVEEAITRLASGAYGVCVDCGQPIARARLEAVPSAARCLACERTFEERGGG